MPSTFPCPNCGEYHYHKSHSRNFYERIRKLLLKQRVYRCHRCGYRAWERKTTLSRKLTLKKVLLYIVVLIISSLFGMLFKLLLIIPLISVNIFTYR